MPLYEVHLSRRISLRDFEPLYDVISQLHANEFKVAAESVRMDFVTEYAPNSDSAFGHRRFVSPLFSFFYFTEI